jgi:GrpB-like predicted nucleotidyltransferase (UPF0157 family)
MPPRSKPIGKIGLVSGEVKVVPYDPEWPRLFERIRNRLRSVLPTARIEHIGSTAVPGCEAKPIIDVSVGLTLGSVLRVDKARSIGLEFLAIRPDSVKFALSDERGRHLAYVHMRCRGSEPELRDLRFRDFLRAHPDVVRDYVKVKHQAMATTKVRRDYTDAKAPFIEGLEPRIRRWARRTRWVPGHSTAK